MQICQKFNALMSLKFVLLTCCADLSTGDQLIIRRKYPNAPESESDCLLATRQNDPDQGD